MRIFIFLSVIIFAALVYFGLQTNGFGMLAVNYKTKMASSAHGALFNDKGEVVEVTAKEVLRFQTALLSDIEAEKPGKADELLLGIAENAAKALSADNLPKNNAVLLRAIRVTALWWRYNWNNLSGRKIGKCLFPGQYRQGNSAKGRLVQHRPPDTRLSRRHESDAKLHRLSSRQQCLPGGPGCRQFHIAGRGGR